MNLRDFYGTSAKKFARSRSAPRTKVIDSNYTTTTPFDPTARPSNARATQNREKFKAQPGYGGFGRFGADASSAVDQARNAAMNVAMKTVIGTMRVALAKAQFTVDSKLSGTGLYVVSVILPLLAPFLVAAGVAVPEATKEGVSNALKSIGRQIDLRERNIADVLNGTLPLAKWVAASKSTYDGIGEILQVLGENNFAANMKVTISNAYDDLNKTLDSVGDKLNKIAPYAPAAFGGIFALLLGIGILVYLPVIQNFLPRRRER